ncbi:MAG TPA: hypothetical protein VII25_10960 [Candidatus Acidoferrum sp.]
MPTEPTSTVGGTPRATKFLLAANYDPELVPALAPYPVDEVYGRFAAQAVSLSPQYRTEALEKYAEMEDTMIAGGLWGV